MYTHTHMDYTKPPGKGSKPEHCCEQVLSRCLLNLEARATKGTLMTLRVPLRGPFKVLGVVGGGFVFTFQEMASDTAPVSGWNFFELA